MDQNTDRTSMFERDPAVANTHWENETPAAARTIDPSYDRATAALRRWVDGMEAALHKRKS
jgi:hypothetical protein